MLFKLEESGFIICICLILLTSCIMMYYFHTRISMIENSVSKQNQVLADFFSTVQNELKGGNSLIGEDIHLADSRVIGKSSHEIVGVKKESDEVLSKKSKIDVSDDDHDDDDYDKKNDKSGIKIVKVLKSSSYSDSESYSDTDFDMDSDTETDKEDFEHSSELKPTTDNDARRKLNRDNEMVVNAIEELVEEKEKLCSINNKLDIKEIFLINGNELNSSSSSSNISSLMMMIKDIDDVNVKGPNYSNTCIVEEVVDDSSVTNNNSDSEVLALNHDESSSTNLSSENKESLGDDLKKMKIIKTSGNSLTEKEPTKKEGVADLRNKAVLLGLVSKEESAKLKKNELLELIKSSNDTKAQ